MYSGGYVLVDTGSSCGCGEEVKSPRKDEGFLTGRICKLGLVSEAADGKTE